jgi:hypothetical protein
MTQEKKKELAHEVRLMLANRYPDVKIRASFSVQNDSICMTIQACSLDLLAGKQGNYMDVNVYNIDRAFDGQARDLMQSCVDCLNQGNWDNSDHYTDYYDVGWYVDIRIGTWYEPFQLL